MAPALPGNLRFAVVVECLGTTQKTVENWLQRKQIHLPSGLARPGSWREFNAADVAYLALVLKLAQLGVPVTVAGEAATSVLAGSTAVQLSANNSTSPDAIAARYSGQRLLVWRDCDRWLTRVDRECSNSSPPASAYIIIHVQQVLSEAIERAVASGATMERFEQSLKQLASLIE